MLVEGYLMEKFLDKRDSSDQEQAIQEHQKEKRRDRRRRAGENFWPSSSQKVGHNLETEGIVWISASVNRIQKDCCSNSAVHEIFCQFSSFQKPINST